MDQPVRIELQPLGETFEVPMGSEIQDQLFEHGVEFPCGGAGKCKGCRIRVLAGDVPITPRQREQLSREELEAGWRLGCCATAGSDLVLEIGQWEGTILTDSSAFEFHPQQGLGISVDLGTTTIVGQLLDLRSAGVLAVETHWNPQARHGADVMSRIEFAVRQGKQEVLQRLVRQCVGEMICRLLETYPAPRPPLRRVVVVGNTVMHHLFCGIDLAPLAGVPFEPTRDGLEILSTAQLGWPLPDNAEVRFLPCLGGFVGSDVLAGVLATRLHESEKLAVLLDLGTNGEIVVGNRDRMLCASTAAGPAFEGARIARGMRAATGAISRVERVPEDWVCHVLGGGKPVGICGSGLVDAIAVGLDNGRIAPSGRLADGASEWTLLEPVAISQRDVRELQLAKGAVAAGVHILLEQWGAAPEDVERVHLAGAFGNYVDRESARRIGLITFPRDRIEPAGNTALLGAKMALFTEDNQDCAYPDLLAKIAHVSLASDTRFQDLYVEGMLFPRRDGSSTEP